MNKTKFIEIIFVICLIAGNSLQTKLQSNKNTNEKKAHLNAANCKYNKEELDPILKESQKHLSSKVTPQELVNYLKSNNYNNGSGISMEYINQYVQELVDKKDPRIIFESTEEDKINDFLKNPNITNKIDLDDAIVEYDNEINNVDINNNNSSERIVSDIDHKIVLKDELSTDKNYNNNKTSSSNLINNNTDKSDDKTDNKSNDNNNDNYSKLSEEELKEATKPIENKEAYSYKDIKIESLEPIQHEYYDIDYNLLDKSLEKKVLEEKNSEEDIQTNTYDPEYEVFNKDRDDRGWIYQGPLGVKFISEGIVRCGHSAIYLYVLVPKGVEYDTKKFVATISDELLNLWNSKPVLCYSNTVVLPLIEVAQENSMIDDSHKDRICYYGRKIIITDKEGNETDKAVDSMKIKSLYYQLDKSLTMNCDNNAWMKLMTNRFKFNDTYYTDGEHKDEKDKIISSFNYGMNSCYCGIIGTR